MKNYKYFVVFSYVEKETREIVRGNCEIGLIRPIKSIEDIYEMDSGIVSVNNLDVTSVVVENYILMDVVETESILN